MGIIGRLGETGGWPLRSLLFAATATGDEASSILATSCATRPGVTNGVGRARGLREAGAASLADGLREAGAASLADDLCGAGAASVRGVNSREAGTAISAGV
eukprot:6492540-Amphidinium_carterae.1